MRKIIFLQKKIFRKQFCFCWKIFSSDFRIFRNFLKNWKSIWKIFLLEKILKNVKKIFFENFRKKIFCWKFFFSKFRIFWNFLKELKINSKIFFHWKKKIKKLIKKHFKNFRKKFFFAENIFLTTFKFYIFFRNLTDF